VASLALAVALSVLWLGSSVQAQSTLDYVPGEILVKWAPGQVASGVAMARDHVAALTLRNFPQIGWEHLQIDPTMNVQTAIQKMLQQPGVLAAEPNYIVHLFATLPNDTSFGWQWALNNTGQTVDGVAGTAGADISMTTAWDLRTTSPNIVVAVIDSGITLNHTDLKSNLWVNPGEIPGNGIDDDGNGKIDDVNGWDFVNNDNDPSDDNNHGTHVSGIIGAKGNDAYGIAGVTWTVQLMALKSFNSSGSGTTANEISAIQYATAKGAHVINASWGGSGFSQALKDAIDAFPGIFVAAAGNDGTNNDLTPQYPACYTSANIIAVAATDQNDALASFSNFGTTCVDLAAPGVNIYSDISGGSFAYMDGTSMAAPHVSGVAALLKAQESNRTTVEIRSAILSNVDVKASLSGKVATGGRLNARAALAAIAPFAPTALAGTAAGPTQIDLTWTDNSPGETGNEVQRKTGSGDFATLASLAANSTSYSDTTAVEATTYTYRVRAINSGANSDFSSEVSVTTPPAAPSGLTATTASASGITLVWTDNSGGETGYEIQRKTGTGAFASVTTTAANVTSYSDSGLAVETTYTYRVRATGSGGNSAFSAEASATILAAPSGLTAIGLAASDTILAWTDNSGRETGYEIQRKTGTGAFATVTTTAASVTSYSDSGLAAGTVYTYRVRATGSGGNSAFSAEASATTLAVSSGGGGNCFIATAAFGSPLAVEVQVLREFRDRVLLPNAPGRGLVRAYYRHSPPLAHMIERHETLRAATRGALRPVLWWVSLALASPALALALCGGTLVAGPITTVLLLHARRSRAAHRGGRRMP